MVYHTKEIDITRIYLDNENPRHDPIDSEPDIIAHLIAKDGVKPLARDIAEAGATSPLERIGVIAHPTVQNAYISVEGNRRVCALKLLADPDKADSEANKKYFRRLAGKMKTLPEAIEAVVFKDRTSARRWVSLRHEGEQGGVGTKQWGSEEKARFNNQGARRSNPNVQAYLLKDYARQKGLLGARQIEEVNVTTLTRYLSNPLFRATLGLVDHKTLTITVPAEEFDRAVTRFLVDSLDAASGVNSRSDAASRRAYAERLRSEAIAPRTRNLEPFDVAKGPRPAEKGERKPEAKKQRNNRSPDARRTVIPRSYSAHIGDKILKRLYDELRELDAETFSFAATYLLRAVIERAATLYLQSKGKALEGELHKKLERVASLLAAGGISDRDLKMLRTMASDKDSRYSPDTIGHFVHGGAVPTRTQAIRLWDSIEPVMTAIFNQL